MFFYPERSRVQGLGRTISYAVVRPGTGSRKPRHALTLGGDVMLIMGWKVGDRVIVGFGEPGSDDDGWIEVKRAKSGTLLRARNRTSTSAQAQLHYYPPWVTTTPHLASPCFTWNRVDDAVLRVRVPDWVLADAGKEIDDSRGADTARGNPGEKPQPLTAQERSAEAVRSSSRSGPDGGSVNGMERPSPEPPESPDAVAGEGVDVTVRRDGQRGLDITPRQRIVYDELVRRAEGGLETPSLGQLQRLLGAANPAAANNVLEALRASGHIEKTGRFGRPTYLIVATGKSTREREPQHAKHMDEVPEKPTLGPIAPLKMGELPPARSGARPSSLPPVVIGADRPSPGAPAHVVTAMNGDAALAEILNEPVSRAAVIAWLNETGMTCAKIGDDNYVLGDDYVGWRSVLARANRKRRLRKEPEFVV